jgi:hypothetical protein
MNWNGGIIEKRLNFDSTFLLQDQFYKIHHDGFAAYGYDLADPVLPMFYVIVFS